MEQPYIVVVGGVNLDVLGKSLAALIPEDSNPGTVRPSLGGVGRNVAHDLALLGTRVYLLTAVAGDAWEGEAIEGPDGDLALALCDDSLTAHVTPSYLAGQQALLDGAAAVAADTNLPGESLAWLAAHCKAPLFADPVSVTKAEKLRPLMGQLFLLKPNRLEAEALSGIRITDRNSLELAAARLLRTGLRRVCISLGSRGVYCAWDTERCLTPCPPTEPVNASGGGDAMMAGFLRAFLDGLPIEDAARFALACGAIAVEGPETINPALCYAAARRRAAL